MSRGGYHHINTLDYWSTRSTVVVSSTSKNSSRSEASKQKKHRKPCLEVHGRHGIIAPVYLCEYRRVHSTTTGNRYDLVLGTRVLEYDVRRTRSSEYLLRVAAL